MMGDSLQKVYFEKILLELDNISQSEPETATEHKTQMERYSLNQCVKVRFTQLLNNTMNSS